MPKITNLPTKENLTGEEVIPVVDITDVGPTHPTGKTKKVAIADIMDIILGNLSSKKKILFSNNNGSTDNTITLSESVANFEYVEVYTDTGYQKIYSPNGRSVVVSTTLFSDTLYYNYMLLSFSGNTLSISYKGAYYGGSHHPLEKKVYRVVGYRA